MMENVRKNYLHKSKGTELPEPKYTEVLNYKDSIFLIISDDDKDGIIEYFYNKDYISQYVYLFGN
jgi:hypothetical protein